jgi:hypothetical protein
MKRSARIRFVLFSAVALPLAAAVPALARAADRPPAPPAPPPEAYAACADIAEGQPCSVAMGDRSVEGTCAASEDGALSCRPDRGPPRGPPPEAHAACASSAEGDACTVAFGDESAEGTCAVSREGNLFCRLDHPPPPPR